MAKIRVRIVCEVGIPNHENTFLLLNIRMFHLLYNEHLLKVCGMQIPNTGHVLLSTRSLGGAEHPVEELVFGK